MVMDKLAKRVITAIAITAALLAAVWVGVMIADGPTTSTPQAETTQTNGYKATNVPAPTEDDWETEQTLDDLQWQWENVATERDRIATCADYRTYGQDVVETLFANLMMEGAYADPTALTDWVHTVCGEY